MASSTPVEFRILGPLEVVGPGGDSIEIGSPRQRAILTALALHAGETVSSARLIDGVWGEQAPPGARHTLSVHVSNLRHAIGAERVETGPSGYRLRSDRCTVDLQAFEALVAAASKSAEAGDPEDAAERLTAALALWRGEALEDLDGAASRAEWTRLNELHVLALGRRIDADLACGRHLELIPELRRIVAEVPFQEAFAARLMVALYRSGRQAEALDVYHATRGVLDRELGVEPGEELEALQRAILDHDQALTAGLPPGRSRVDAPAPSGLLATSPSSESAAAVPRQRDGRRVVTALVADLRGTTGSGAPLDPEAWRPALDCRLVAMRAILERDGAAVEPIAGSGLLAVFGLPRVHEDDALRAVRAAEAMREMLDRSGAGPRDSPDLRAHLRVGIDTGVVVTRREGGPGSSMTGDVLSAAAGLARNAAAGEILLADGTNHLVRWAAETEPRDGIPGHGDGGPAAEHRLVRLTVAVGPHALRLDSPLVGREPEMELLRTALQRVTGDATCVLFTLLGSAGVGKSRLVHEFAQAVRPAASVIRGRCPAYGERGAFWPVVEAIRQALVIDERAPAESIRDGIERLLGGDAEATMTAGRIASLLGVAEPGSRGEEVTAALQRTFEALARIRPLVIVLDDIQWGEPSFLDFVELLGDSSRGLPILLLCIARPELLEVRPAWGGGKLSSSSVFLGPLGTEEATVLIRNLIGGGETPEAIRRVVVDAAEGNPLFVEEFLAMLLEEDFLRPAPDGWVVGRDLAAVAMPASITALLTDRLDRLPEDEREVLELAAVIGKTFAIEAVEALASREGSAGLCRPEVAERLAALIRKDFIRSDRGSAPTSSSFRFRHLLIRDAAYAGLAKLERSEVHERYADVLAREATGGRSDDEEAIGYHLEQAAQLRHELGIDDERTRDLARRAAQFLGAAGVHALQRGDPLASGRLLQRCRDVWRRSRCTDEMTGP